MFINNTFIFSVSSFFTTTHTNCRASQTRYLAYVVLMDQSDILRTPIAVLIRTALDASELQNYGIDTVALTSTLFVDSGPGRVYVVSNMNRAVHLLLVH